MDSNDTTHETAFSRRRLMGAAGVLSLAAAGATIAAAPSVAGAKGSGPNTDALGNSLVAVSPDTISSSSVPALTAGYSYFSGNQFGFQSAGAGTDQIRTITADGVWAFNAYVVCPLHIAAGTRVRELTIFGYANGTNPTLSVWEVDLDGAVSNPLLPIVLPAGTTPLTPVTVACDFTIDASKSYDLEMFTANANSRIFAFRIGSQPAAAFVPITPYRAYDSRKAGVPSPGVLPRLTSRVVNVVHAINDAGAVAVPNVIPATARAVTYNLTATGTTGDNYLSIAPGLAASTTVSSINFAANQTIANAATVSLDTGTVKVFCGDNVGSSHFIIDITGYYI